MVKERIQKAGCLLTVALLLQVLSAGCAAASRPGPEQADYSARRLEFNMDGNPGTIKLVRILSYVRQGADMSITVRGEPGVSYSITATYRTTRTTMTAVRNGIAASDGLIAWTWNVGKSTLPGTYPITVSGNGNTLITQYTVTKW